MEHQNRFKFGETEIEIDISSFRQDCRKISSSGNLSEGLIGSRMKPLRHETKRNEAK